MLRKKEVFTTITPIPGFIPRQLAIDILHSHSEVITLNPLVLGHNAIPAPRNAASDEFYSTWYEIIERIQYIPGMGKLGSGKISFNGCFHDMPWGLQTHIYAPMNVDLRNTYRIAGNQPGVELPEPLEIGLADLGVPSDGLYLREDIEIRCNIAVVGFVKSELKKASKEMVRRIIKKAELLDAGVLKAMIYEGKLKTINPNDRSNTLNFASPGSVAGVPYNPPLSPRLLQQQPSQGVYFQGMNSQLTPPSTGVAPSQLQQQQQQFMPVEMPGDFFHPQASPSFMNRESRNSQSQPSPSFPPREARNSLQPSPTLQYRENRNSQASTGRQSYTSSHSGGGGSEHQRSSYQYSNPPNEPSSGYASPGMDHKGFAAELETHEERPEMQQRQDVTTKGPLYHYDPRDFSNVRG